MLIKDFSVLTLTPIVSVDLLASIDSILKMNSSITTRKGQDQSKEVFAMVTLCVAQNDFSKYCFRAFVCSSVRVLNGGTFRCY